MDLEIKFCSSLDDVQWIQPNIIRWSNDMQELDCGKVISVTTGVWLTSHVDLLYDFPCYQN